jgi:tetratricopeptide (TPR) repeat protein
VSAFTDRNGLAVFVDRYRPAYIVPALGNTKFPTLIKEFPQYHLVFFDDVEALYVDREQFPEIAERFNLVHLDPFALQDLRLASFTREERAAVLAELYTMEKIFPAGQMVNQLLVLAERYQGNQLGALTHAMAIVTNHPQSPTGYKLAGEELLLFDRYEEARGFFQEALIRSGEQAKTPLYRSLWLCAKELGNSSQAYAALRSAVNPFAAEAAWADILTLARAAVDSSHFREAQVFLQLLAVRIPPAEKQAVAEWRALQMVVDNAE